MLRLLESFLGTLGGRRRGSAGWEGALDDGRSREGSEAARLGRRENVGIEELARDGDEACKRTEHLLTGSNLAER